MRCAASESSPASVSGRHPQHGPDLCSRPPLDRRPVPPGVGPDRLSPRPVLRRPGGRLAAGREQRGEERPRRDLGKRRGRHRGVDPDDARGHPLLGQHNFERLDALVGPDRLDTASHDRGQVAKRGAVFMIVEDRACYTHAILHDHGVGGGSGGRTVRGVGAECWRA
jgi:hypothetical protein